MGKNGPGTFVANFDCSKHSCGLARTTLRVGELHAVDSESGGCITHHHSRRLPARNRLGGLGVPSVPVAFQWAINNNNIVGRLSGVMGSIFWTQHVIWRRNNGCEILSSRVSKGSKGQEFSHPYTVTDEAWQYKYLG